MALNRLTAPLAALSVLGLTSACSDKPKTICDEEGVQCSDIQRDVVKQITKIYKETESNPQFNFSQAMNNGRSFVLVRDKNSGNVAIGFRDDGLAGPCVFTEIAKDARAFACSHQVPAQVVIDGIKKAVQNVPKK